MNDEQIEHIFTEIILPELTECAQRSERPITVFLGGQPGAGKTKGQQRVVEMYPQRELLPIIGDDFRQHHPEYEYLVENEPFRMPDETAYAAGRWTGMAVDYAKSNGISCIIEGTWRNLDTVLDEAKADRSRKRGTHAVIVAVPPLFSRIGTLGRFYFDLDEAKEARWTPPEAHENTVRALDTNVPRIARSGLMDQLTVLDRKGNVHYDGTNPEKFIEAWEGQFKRDLTDEERETAQTQIELVSDIAHQYSPDSRTVFEMLDKLTKDVEFYSGGTPASFDGVKTTGSVYVREHTRDGRHVNGYWRRK